MYGLVILAAVPHLSSDDWRTREAATAVLAAAGQKARPVLLEAANGPDPEARSRAHLLLSRLLHSRLDSFRPFPPIDGMWYDERLGHYAFESDEPLGLIRKVYYRYYAFALSRNLYEPGDYHHYRAATRLLVWDWMTAGRSDEWIRGRLAEIGRRDRAWRRRSLELAIARGNVVFLPTPSAPFFVPTEFPPIPPRVTPVPEVMP